jgi:hypothetical protein
MRAETGAMRFAGDWPGLFIRGDEALMGYVPSLAQVLAFAEAAFENVQVPEGDRLQLTLAMRQLEGLSTLLKGCEGGDALEVPNDLKAFGECRA